MEFQIAGITILLLFYGCYLMKMRNQHKKGIETDQLGRGKSGSVKMIELTVKVATYLALVVEALSILLNTYELPISLRIVGGLIGGSGAAVFIASVLTMRDSWRAGVSKTEKTRLVTGGLYQISRNPAFLGFDLVYIGIAMMFSNGVLLAVSFFAAFMLHLQIVKVEEAFLLERFGTEYAAYKEKVCRYLGRRR
ncbi:MAG: isoprenylcysteine carboxylmethyltransferase family protein [Oscillospiraceae bacterium]|nr:isoprenylcysteine carboxylmethyltransferase family protein [Oscillospiraceae bacterium]